MTLLIIILSLLSAIFYRIGGAGKEEISFARGWIRDTGCMFCLAIACFLSGYGYFMPLFISCGLFYASITTYWDFIFKYDNYWIHGFMLGFSMIPMYFFNAGVEFFPIILRSLVLSVSFGALSLIPWPKKANVWIQESGRGALIIATLPIILT